MGVASYDQLFEAAVARSQDGFDALDPHFEEGTRVLIRDADRHASLNLIGRRLFQTELLHAIEERARYERVRGALPRPVARSTTVIMGSPRSRSTWLHNALAQGLPGTASLPMWAAMAPFPAAGERDEDHCRRGHERAATHLDMCERLAPALLQMHPMRPSAPEECITLMRLTGASYRWPLVLYVPEYRAWLESLDFIQVYLEYDQILQAVLGPQRHLLLKAPHHSLRTAEITAAMQPEVIWLERDPTAVDQSFRALVRACRSIFTSDVVDADWRDVWTGLDPPDGATVVRYEDVEEYARSRLADSQVAWEGSFVDWLRPTPEPVRRRYASSA